LNIYYSNINLLRPKPVTCSVCVSRSVGDVLVMLLDKITLLIKSDHLATIS